MRARDAMTRNVVWVNPELSLSEAAEMMEEWEIRHLPVVSDGRVVGILSDRDVLLRSTLQDDGEVAVDESTVGEAMTADPVTCKANSTLASLATAMIERKIDSLPVIGDDGELAGLVTSTDLLEILLTRERDSTIRDLPLRFQVVKGGATRASAVMS